VIGFFNTCRDGQRVTRNLLRDVAAQFHHESVPSLRGDFGAPPGCSLTETRSLDTRRGRR
jgi:hypothetical protein